MVLTWQNSDRTKASIMARGNFSLDADGLVSLLLALAAVSLGLAVLLALQGYWPILLIAAVQLALVAWILIRAWARAWVSDVIDISADRITVTQQRYKRKRRVELDTAWTVVEVKQPEIAWYRPRVQLRSGSQVVELGTFLTSEEKRQLAQYLESAIVEHSAMKGAFNF